MKKIEVKELNKTIASDEFRGNIFNGFFKNDIPNPLMEYQHKAIYILTCVILMLSMVILAIYLLIENRFDPRNEHRMVSFLLLCVYFSFNVPLNKMILDKESSIRICDDKLQSEYRRFFIASSILCNLLMTIGSIFVIIMAQWTYYALSIIYLTVLYIYFFAGTLFFMYGVRGINILFLYYFFMNISIIISIYIILKE